MRSRFYLRNIEASLLNGLISPCHLPVPFSPNCRIRRLPYRKREIWKLSKRLLALLTNGRFWILPFLPSLLLHYSEAPKRMVTQPECRSACVCVRVTITCVCCVHLGMCSCVYLINRPRLWISIPFHFFSIWTRKKTTRTIEEKEEEGTLWDESGFFFLSRIPPSS